jgi:putative ABC transport system permease protein
MKLEQWIHIIPLRLRSLFDRQRVNKELDDELQYHLERKIEENIAEGMSAQEAQRSALLDLRGLERTKQECQDVMPLRWLDHLRRDVRYAFRMLAKKPGFTAVAVTALALGIGADTAMYTIVNGALSWDMGLDNRDEIVAVTSLNTAHSQQWSTSFPDFRDYRSQVKSLAGLAAYRLDPVNVSDHTGLPERYYCVEMSANGFSLVQQKPLLGRDFIPADEKPGAAPVVMLGYHVWRDRYARDPAIVGKSITINEIPRTVIGVMPPGRRFPEETDLWVPLLPNVAREQRGNRELMLFGRLRKGVPLASVRAEIIALAQNLAAQYPKTNKDMTAVVMPIMELTGLYLMKPLILALFVVVGFVLLIACADVANMLLARAAERSREISIRVAIGAGKISIFRQLLIESTTLSVLGGLLGWPVAVGGLRWFDSGTGTLTTRPVWLHLSLDRSAFFYLAAISVGTGILFGLAPALHLAKSEANAALKDSGGPGLMGSKSSLRLSNVLVAVQMALCVVLLADAGLLVRSAVNVYAAPIGVNTNNVLTMRVNLPEAKYANPDTCITFHDRLHKRLAALPAVQLSGLASNLPLGGWLTFDFQFEGRVDDPAHRPEAGGLVVSNSYFQLMQVQAARGRLFSATDGKSGPPVAIVSQTFAEKFWPNGDALGKRVRLIDDRSPGPWLTVVGVVPDIPQNFRDCLEHDPLIYVPFSEIPQRQIFLVARTAVPPANLADTFRREVQKLDANLPVYEVRTLENRIAENRLSVSLFGAVCSVFAGIATVLAAIGLYAVIAHGVNRRTQEIGLRIALGATRRDVLRLVAAQSLGPLLPGATVGVLLALAATRVLHTALRGVSPSDPATFAGTLAVLLLAALLGCAVPARRAVRVDPMVALRHE